MRTTNRSYQARAAGCTGLRREPPAPAAEITVNLGAAAAAGALLSPFALARTPLGRTVPAGAAKYAQRGTSGSFLALRNLLGFFTAGSLLAQGQLSALCGKGKCVGGRPHERVSGGHRLRPSPQSCLALG